MPKMVIVFSKFCIIFVMCLNILHFNYSVKLTYKDMNLMGSSVSPDERTK